MDTLSRLDISNLQSFNGSYCQLQNFVKANDRQNVIAEISDLALYTYERDIESGKISQMKLSWLEEKGEIVGSHIFFRMARHYYFEEKVTQRDYSTKRILCATIHANLGNVFFLRI